MPKKVYHLSTKRVPKRAATKPRQNKSEDNLNCGTVNSVQPCNLAVDPIGLAEANAELVEKVQISSHSVTGKRKMVVEDGVRASKKVKMPKVSAEEEIQQKIEDQIRMREGAMKLMSASSTLQQALEVSKNLLTINARVLGLMSALQKARECQVMKEYNKQRNSVNLESPISPCVGKLSIEDIRVPLMWKDNVHFTGKTGDQTYYAFALVRCGDQVRDTTLHQVLVSDTDVYFDRSLLFNEVGPDFKMEFELYYTVIQENSMLRTPIRTPSRKVHHIQAPKFCLAGHVQLTIDDVRKGIISKDLLMGSQGAIGTAVLGDMSEFPPHPLELWGQICCSLAAQPQCMVEEDISGNILLQEYGVWQKYHCSLIQCKLKCWLEKEHSINSQPATTIEIKQTTVVGEAAGDDGPHPYGISLTSHPDVSTLAFEDMTESHRWLIKLRTAVLNLQSWKKACESLMKIHENRKRVLMNPSAGSFYDQIKIGELKNTVPASRTPDGHGLINPGFMASPASPNMAEQASKRSSTDKGQPETPRSASNSSAPSTPVSPRNELLQTASPLAESSVPTFNIESTPTQSDSPSPEPVSTVSSGEDIKIVNNDSDIQTSDAKNSSEIAEDGSKSPEALPVDVIAEATEELESLDRVLDDSVAESESQKDMVDGLAEKKDQSLDGDIEGVDSLAEKKSESGDSVKDVVDGNVDKDKDIVDQRNDQDDLSSKDMPVKITDEKSLDENSEATKSADESTSAQPQEPAESAESVLVSTDATTDAVGTSVDATSAAASVTVNDEAMATQPEEIKEISTDVADSAEVASDANSGPSVDQTEGNDAASMVKDTAEAVSDAAKSTETAADRPDCVSSETNADEDDDEDEALDKKITEKLESASPAVSADSDRAKGTDTCNSIDDTKSTSEDLNLSSVNTLPMEAEASLADPESDEEEALSKKLGEEENNAKTSKDSKLALGRTNSSVQSNV